MPAGCIFADKGPAAFVDCDDPDGLLSLCAIVNSQAFGALVRLQLARTELAQSYEVGLIQQTPVPDLAPADQAALAHLARRAWSLKRALDTRTESSHAFTLPALLQVEGATLQASAQAWADLSALRQQEIDAIQAEIDDRCFALYGISPEDRQSIEAGFGAATDDAEPTDADEDADDDTPEEVDASPMVASLLSWSLGVALGRFDLRLAEWLATREREPPPEPDPFAPLPASSPGMLTGPDALPVAALPPGYPIAFPADGILADDPGADRDLLARVRQVFGIVFGERGDDRLNEARDLFDPKAPDLRPWLRSKFFDLHIKRYSKSRRKAPIYWQLGTPSASYSVWLYLHRMGPDTLHAVLRDHVEPKLRFETNRLASLRTDAGDSPAPSQRKDIDAQESFTDELRAFRDELKRIAPLWNPDLDDGVVINASFLHRLFLHTRSWAKECESHWDKLIAGDYDWAHLAMRLWPQRVVPKCAEDRSLAIAHGLEDALWFEDSDGKWQPRETDDATLDRLVRERTSPAVKDALSQLSDAPPPSRTSRAARPAATRTPRTRRAEPAATGAQMPLQLATPASGPTPAVLDALRAALHQHPDGASRSVLLAASGIDEADLKPAIDALVASGDVVKTGAARGTRYHLFNPGG